MNSQGNPIINENYADLIMEVIDEDTIIEKFGDAPRSVIYRRTMVVHVPVESITNNAVYEFGYFTMPSVFGLVSYESLEASRVPRLRAIPNFDLKGQGILLGFIDTGIDYTNPIFQYEDKTTRIVSLWDQSIDSGPPPEGFYYGTEFQRFGRALSYVVTHGGFYLQGYTI